MFSDEAKKRHQLRLEAQNTKFSCADAQNPLGANWRSLITLN